MAAAVTLSRAEHVRRMRRAGYRPGVIEEISAWAWQRRSVAAL
jgi:hypothetical protein